MIYFLSTRRKAGPLGWYLRGHGKPLARRFVPMTYEALVAARSLPDGAYCFADLELLSLAERERAAAVWQQLQERGLPLLNHPTRSMMRYDLLKELRRRGLNRFDVHRLQDAPGALRFPVFVRSERDHAGARTPLLADRDALEGAVARLRQGGDLPEDALVVEFCDTSVAGPDGGAGVFAKYGAFIFGDEILPRHLFYSRHWMLKEWDLVDEAHLRAEREYLRTNPHAEALRAIARIAGITYGRIDYSVTADGAVQVWEINTHPTIAGLKLPRGRLRRAARKLRDLLAALAPRLPFAAPFLPSAPRTGVHRQFAEALADRWLSIDGAAGTSFENRAL